MIEQFEITPTDNYRHLAEEIGVTRTLTALFSDLGVKKDVTIKKMDEGYRASTKNVTMCIPEHQVQAAFSVTAKTKEQAELGLLISILSTEKETGAHLRTLNGARITFRNSATSIAT